ncbi:MAG: MFS transporter [Candidatus Zixiibacteriota bacterium]
MGSSINVALPPIAEEFAADALTMSWVPTVYLLAAAVFLLPFGRLADLYGRKRIFGIGIAVYSIGSLLAAMAPSILWLIILRILQGIGGSMIFGTGVAIVTSVYPPAQRGKALGIIVGAVYLGLSLGPFIGGILTHNFGWRSLFLVNVVMGLIPLVLVLWRVHGEWRSDDRGRFDLGGGFIYGIGLILLMYGFSQLPGIRGAIFAAAGGIGIFVFVVWENRVASPLLNMGLFRQNTLFAFSNLAALINYSATFAVTFLVSLYLQYTKGFSTQEAGTVLVAQPVMMALLSPWAGRLSDRIQSRIVASIGMAATVVGLLLLSALRQDSPLWYVLLCLVCNGIGFGLFSSPNTNAVMGSITKQYYGVASATVATMRLTGQMLSMGVAMLVLAIFVGPVAITPEYYPAFIDSCRTTFLIFAGLCIVGVYVSLKRGDVDRGSVR